MKPILNYRKFFSWQLLIFVLPFIIYLSSFHYDFSVGDDQNILLNNVYLRDWKFFPNFFTENLTAGSGAPSNFWRPFLLIGYSVIVHTVGFKPWPFHLFAILLHSFSGLLIFTIFSRLMQKKAKPAILASMVLLWQALPIHTEELAGAAGTASPSCLFWMLLGLFSFLNFERRKKKAWYVFSLTSFIFALFSKESAIIFPGLLLGMHILGIKTGFFDKIKIKGYIFRHFAFWLIALFYVIARLSFLNFNNSLNFYNEANIFTQNLNYRIFTLFTVLTHGLRIIFLPWGLHPEKSWPVFVNFFSLQVVSSTLVLAAIIIAAIASWKKNPLFSFGIFWFFCCYFPMSNIAAQINALVWDHWFYAPSLGIILSVASLLFLLKNNFYQKAVVLFLAAMIILFSLLTFRHASHWKNAESFYRLVLAYEPNSAKSWNNLAMSLKEPGEEEESIKYYLKAIEISDTYPQTHHNLANTYRDLGKFDLAEKEFLVAIQLDSRFYQAYLGLGNLKLMQNKPKEALAYFRKALEIYPYLPAQAVDFINKLTEQESSSE